MSDNTLDEDPKPLPRDPQNDATLDTDERRDRRKQRHLLFIGGAAFAGMYLLILPLCIVNYVNSGKIPILDEEGGWKSLVAVDAAFAFLAFIPMSIFWTLAKIASPSSGGGADSKTDGEALAQSIYDACTSIKDVIISIKDAVKK
ncbi:hypothetical protein [Gluconobacter albidus]|uniref:hypothetical protein n=1 Tax=Gluconobacter albidus TaxID=318683 RepID=UPI0030B7C6EF